jgi:hypothetical protein
MFTLNDDIDSEMGEGKVIRGDIGPFTRLNVAGDGNCFFEALAVLLQIDVIDGMYLRALAAAELRSRLDLYIEFFAADIHVDAYIRRMSQNGVWVDGIAMTALRNALRRSGILNFFPTFSIYHEIGHWQFRLGDDPQHPVYHFFYNGTHYDAYRPNIDAVEIDGGEDVQEHE